MIPKGNRRGGGQNLATHLLNAFNNERVEVAGLRGAVARDLHGAFAEWRALASATRCTKYLYSLSVNPDQAKYDLTRDQYLDYITRAEKNLGLDGQPRAIVFHTKSGREHCHVVWSRINPDKIIAVLNSHDRNILRRVTQEFARDHGLELPPGMRKDRGKDRFKDRDKVENLKEQQQTERTGIGKAERRHEITQAWQRSDNGHAFVNGLEMKGYILARGERHGKPSYAVVDLYGQIHSLSRQLDGVTAKDMKARLSSHPLDRLPSIEDAKSTARQRQEQMRARVDEAHKEKAPSADEKREALSEIQAARRHDLDGRRDAMLARHDVERDALKDLHESENTGVISARLEKQPKGLTAFLTRITGIKAFVEYRHKKEDKAREVRHADQAGALKRRHGREAEDMDSHYHDLARLEKRENSSMALQMRREAFKNLRTDARTIQPEFEKAAKGQEPQSTAAGGGATLADKFKRPATRPVLGKGDLQAALERAKAAKSDLQPQKLRDERSPDEIDQERLEQARRTRDELQKRKDSTDKTPGRGPDKDRER